MSSSTLERFFSSTSPAKLSVLVGVYLSSLVLIAVLGFYMLFYALALFSFLFLAPILQKTSFFRRLNTLPYFRLLLALYAIAFVLRAMMLYQDQVITNDMSLMVWRSQQSIAGEAPYKDFPVNKPPLYLYLAHFIGASFGTGLREFRLFFTIFDALVPVVLFRLLRLKYSQEFSAYAALLYAICPLNIIMIGFSGHYEPLVIIPVLLGFHRFFEKHYYSATFLLGIGFAFKLYPLVFLPFFLALMPGWKRRIGAGISFFVPFLLTLVPLAFLVEDGLGYYMDYQTGEWVSIAIKSFALSFILILDSDTLFGVRITELVMYFFLGIIVVFFMSWVGKTGEEGVAATDPVRVEGQSRGLEAWVRRQTRGRPVLFGLLTGVFVVDFFFGLAGFISVKLNLLLLKLKETKRGDIILVWYKIMVVTFAFYYVLETATTFKLFKTQWGIPHANPVMFLVALIFFPLVFLFLKTYYHQIFPKKEKLKLDDHQELYYLSIFTTMFLLFSSPDYCPWYIMWFLPMLLSLKNNRVKYFLLWIIFWNFPGKDFAVMPGLNF